MTITDFFEYLTGQVDHQPWRERAACKDLDASFFYLERGGSPRAIQRVCAGCDVRQDCLDYALAHHEDFGWWGGVSERQRKRMRRGREPVVVEIKLGPIAELRTQRNRRRVVG